MATFSFGACPCEYFSWGWSIFSLGLFPESIFQRIFSKVYYVGNKFLVGLFHDTFDFMRVQGFNYAALVAVFMLQNSSSVKGELL